MYLKILIVILSLTNLSHESDVNEQRNNELKYNNRPNADAMPSRLLLIMKSYYDDASKRIAELRNIRFKYEISPHYEQGYVIGEIIERYRKIVEHVKRTTQFNETIYPTLDRVEVIQKQYLEVYHLVNMMHEIPVKYASDMTYIHEQQMQTNVSYATQLRDHYMQQYLEAEKRRKEAAKERRNKRKSEKDKKRLLESMGNYTAVPTYQWTTKYKDAWPLEYGWEIDPKIWQ